MDDEALLPPPRRPDATPLSNSDFRKFLDTPRRDAEAPALGQSQRSKPGGKPADQSRKQSKRPPRPRQKQAEDAQADDEQLYRSAQFLYATSLHNAQLRIEHVVCVLRRCHLCVVREEPPGYQHLPWCRDRAEERRKGLNPDYEAANLPDSYAADPKVISVEDSKFLGGDVEHTHLVKGLDFQLLQKVQCCLSSIAAVTLAGLSPLSLMPACGVQVKEELIKPGAVPKDVKPKAGPVKKQVR